MKCPKCSGSGSPLGKHAQHEYKCKECGYEYSQNKAIISGITILRKDYREIIRKFFV